MSTTVPSADAAVIRRIEDLDADPGLKRSLFPVVDHWVFLGHAAVCPLSAPVRRSIETYLARAVEGDQELLFPRGMEREIREMAARLLGVAVDEIALVGPTSLALSFVAEGLDLAEGDNVVIDPADFPSNVYPWLRLRERGVEVRSVGVPPSRTVAVADLERVMDDRTRLVSLASVHYLSGRRLDLAALGTFLRGRGVWFNVDAIQGLGAVDTPGAYADSLAADAHKWLLGPQGVGILAVRRESQERLRPPAVGWRNAQCPDFVSQEEVRYLDGAVRYEAGSHCFAGLAGLHAALRLLLEFGIEAIERRNVERTLRLARDLADRGWELAHPPTRETASAIVSFTRAGEDMGGLHRRLRDARIWASLRSGQDGRHWIRVSPHFYNADTDIERLLSVV